MLFLCRPDNRAKSLQFYYKTIFLQSETPKNWYFTLKSAIILQRARTPRKAKIYKSAATRPGLYQKKQNNVTARVTFFIYLITYKLRTLYTFLDWDHPSDTCKKVSFFASIWHISKNFTFFRGIPCQRNAKLIIFGHGERNKYNFQPSLVARTLT